MGIENLTIIGTSHISKESVKEIRETVEEFKPDLIAIELDKKRLGALMSKEKKRSISISDIRRVGIKGFLFTLIGGYVQKKLGEMVGVKPGSDMLSAIKVAQEKKINLALIDRDIEITLRRFSATLTWKERWNFIVDVFNAIFFKKREMKRLGLEKMDLSKVPPKKLIKKLIKAVEKRYPNIYKVLVHERNIFMSKNLVEIMTKYPEWKIIAVVGAGHEEEMKKLISKNLKKSEDISFTYSTG